MIFSSTFLLWTFHLFEAAFQEHFYISQVIRDALRYVRQLYSSCFIGGTRCVTHFNNPVMSHEWGINGIWPRQTEHFLSHLWYRHSVTVTNGHDNVRITFEVMTSTHQWSRNCITVWRTWVHLWFLLGFVLLSHVFCAVFGEPLFVLSSF
jgi:hypothetical protein